jgi:hypothetical protein
MQKALFKKKLNEQNGKRKEEILISKDDLEKDKYSLTKLRLAAPTKDFKEFFDEKRDVVIDGNVFSGFFSQSYTELPCIPQREKRPSFYLHSWRWARSSLICPAFGRTFLCLIFF